MSKSIQVHAKDLLKMQGVELTAVLNGSVEDALQEFNAKHPDVYYVEHLLSPRLQIKLPGYKHVRTVDVIEDKIDFSCGSGSEFMRFLIRYCDNMNLRYKII